MQKSATGATGEKYIFSPNLYGGKNIISEEGGGEEYDFLGKHIPLLVDY